MTGLELEGVIGAAVAGTTALVTSVAGLLTALRAHKRVAILENGWTSAGADSRLTQLENASVGQAADTPQAGT